MRKLFSCSRELGIWGIICSLWRGRNPFQSQLSLSITIGHPFHLASPVLSWFLIIMVRGGCWIEACSHSVETQVMWQPPLEACIKINVYGSFVDSISAASVGLLPGIPLTTSSFHLGSSLGIVLVWMKRNFGRAMQASISVYPSMILLLWKLVVLFWHLFLQMRTWKHHTSFIRRRNRWVSPSFYLAYTFLRLTIKPMWWRIN